jgi:hypothetical protein
MPTHIEVLEASFVVKLGLTSDLNETQIVAFQLATADWIAFQASLDDVVVKITKQKLLTSNGRRLQDTNDTTTDKVVVVTGLQIDFDTAAEYTGPNKSFDLYAVLNPFFQGLDSSWLQIVAGSDSVFLSIRPSFTPVPLSQGIQDQGDIAMGTASNKADSSGAGAFVVTMAIIVAGLAVLMGIAASVYSVRTHRMAVYGEELESPKDELNYCPSPSNSLGDVTLGSPRSNASTQYGNVELTTSGNIMTNLSDNCCAAKADVLSPASPNTLERGKDGGVDDVFQGLPFRSRTDVDSGRATQDPPTYSEANFSNYQNAYRNKQSLFDASEQRSEISMDSRFMGSQADAFMGANNRAKYMQRQGSGSQSGQQNMSHELMLTKSMGGTLGAADIGRSYPVGSQASASDFGSQAKSFFSGMMGTEKPTAPAAANNSYRSGAPSMEYSNSNVSGTSGNRNGNSNLGARGVGSDDHMPSYDMPSYDTMLRRAGLYDVFAPAGPIGIVVDTTKEGPAVHSLKSTSPMLGLINPGDLIVGLDDQDTRSMTAATLTRLMAKKSSQKEHKITFLATETFY